MLAKLVLLPLWWRKQRSRNDPRNSGADTTPAPQRKTSPLLAALFFLDPTPQSRHADR